MKLYGKYIVAAIIAIMAVSIAMLWRRNGDLAGEVKQQRELLQKQAAALDKALSLKQFSISLSPEITNKVTTTFGSAKNITLQYYFNLDGKILNIQPDSTYQIVKEYKE